MKKKILKHAALDDSYPKVIPTKNTMPSWFKDTSRFANNENKINELPGKHTFKMCSAFTDSFISGYIIPLPVDIAVKQSENGPIISWNDGSSIFIELRDTSVNQTLPTPKGYANMHFAWRIKHMIKIPKGYSALLTHPLNRYDLPFLTLSGIIDGEFVVPDGNIPVYFSDSFEGIIESGTPILQVLLFKTENWKSEEDKNIIEEGKLNAKKSGNVAFGWYKKNIWKKKTYE